MTKQCNARNLTRISPLSIITQKNILFRALYVHVVAMETRNPHPRQSIVVRDIYVSDKAAQCKKPDSNITTCDYYTEEYVI